MPSRPGELLTTTSTEAHRTRPPRSARATTVKSRPRGWRGRRRGRAVAAAIGCIASVIARAPRGLRGRLERLTDDWTFGRRGLVQAAHRRRVRRGARQLRIGLGLAED